MRIGSLFIKTVQYLYSNGSLGPDSIQPHWWCRMKRLLASAVFDLLISAVALCQDTGQITGTVRDNTGAVVPNAKVTVANPAQGITRNVTTNSDGDYLVPGLPAGEYDVTVTASGFQSFQAKNLTLRVAQKTRADAKL